MCTEKDNLSFNILNGQKLKSFSKCKEDKKSAVWKHKPPCNILSWNVFAEANENFKKVNNGEITQTISWKNDMMCLLWHSM